jgi:hypothetical protein
MTNSEDDPLTTQAKIGESHRPLHPSLDRLLIELHLLVLSFDILRLLLPSPYSGIYHFITFSSRYDTKSPGELREHTLREGTSPT